MSPTLDGYRDAAGFQEASYFRHPVEDIEPVEASALSPVRQAGCRYALSLEPRPMRIVAEELGVTIAAISREKRIFEAFVEAAAESAARRRRAGALRQAPAPTLPNESADSIGRGK